MNNKKILVMGVSGCGKSLIGSKLALALKYPFFDGDDYHSAQNIEKMQQGVPLSDQDRLGWLHRLNSLFIDNDRIVIACSALKPEYRDILRENAQDITIVYLKGNFDTIWSRHRSRPNHYFNGKQMLESQFNTLVEPLPSEAITVDVTANVEDVLASALCSIRAMENQA
ncbi:gluconate kinase [Vibrio sp. vnigr-6D03]|uniref:gluconokinase n=1 Tax=Vibrio sp. vnigr-6D03 TaxID=2058088 RepID=UPI000C31E852|nr:gluconokinase [Vibrio sp. vnigr-6D03]PKF77602.1 gluconate kinase [Vibrio sp. vnigr-6D03]